MSIKGDIAYIRLLFWFFVFVQSQYLQLLVLFVPFLLMSYDIKKLRFSKYYLHVILFVLVIALVNTETDLRIVYVLLGIILAPFLFFDFSLLSRNRHAVILPIVVLVLLATLALGYTGRRFRFVLGPNMIYRLVMFSYVILSRETKWKYIYDLLVLYLIVSIGSRGGLLLFSLIWIYRLINSFGWIRSLGVLVAGVVPFAFAYYDVLRLSFGRILYFSLDNASEAYRFGAYTSWIDWLSHVGITNILLGSGFGSWPYDVLYPHNFILEISHALGVILILSWLYSFYSRLTEYFELKLVLFIPAMISGNVIDNFFLFAFL